MNLTPVDFKAVAAKGCFVYCYLRSKGGKHGKKFSPYYVGIATAATEHNRRWRPFASHPGHHIPADVAFVRVLKSGLTKEQAEAWEIRFVARYGLVVEGGILHNKNYGGGSNAGFKHSEQRRAQVSKQMKGNQHTKGRKLDAWHVDILRKNGKALDHAASGRARGLQRAKEAAAKYEMSLETFLSFDKKVRAAICSRFKRGKRGAELIAGLVAA